MGMPQTISKTVDAVPLSGQMTERVLQHLREEEAALVGMLESVQAVRQSLISRDDEALTKSLAQEGQHLQRAEEIRERRQHLRGEIAAELGISAEHVTLHKLCECTLGELCADITRFRQRLAEMSAEVSRLNRQNAALIRQSLDITTAILGQLTGTPPDADCYNAAGVREETRFGSVVQWGG